MLTFLRNLAGVKVDKAAQAGIEALVRWDPKSASEAELRTMEQNLDALGREVALARQGYDRWRGRGSPAGSRDCLRLTETGRGPLTARPTRPASRQ
jgi:hypothetical protein